jgi:hypothetical protein
MLRRFLVTGAVAGFLLPLILLVRWKLTGQIFGLLEVWLWPSSILLMAITGALDASAWLLLAFTVLLNVLVYVLLAAIVYAAIHLFGRWLPVHRAEP